MIPPDAEVAFAARTAPPNRLVVWTVGVLLVAITFVVYLPATKCGFIWDDDAYVQDNQTLRSAAGLRDIWLRIGATPQYYPLVFTTFWLEYHLWGLHPLGYHLVNILLHAFAVVLLWRTLRLLNVPGALFAAAVFALHPVHVESVAWVTERKNVLSAVFYFSAALTYLRWRLADNGAAMNVNLGRCWRPYLAALLLFLFALLSKTVTSTLPAAILLVVWWKRGRLAWREVVLLLPFFAAGLGLGLVTAWMEKHHVGAAGEQWSLSFVERCLVAGRALWFYLGKLVWPHPLIFIYPRWQIDAGDWRQYLHPLAAIAGLLTLLLTRRRIGRGPLAAALFFGGTLLPALGFFSVFPMRYSFVADHFQYLASIGPIALAAGIACTAARRYGRPGRNVAIAGSILLLGVLGILTWRQGAIYTNAEELWRQTLAANPRAWMAHNNLGLIHQSRGELAEAMECYQKAIAVEPRSAETLCNIGVMLINQGRADESYKYFRKAIDVMPNNPLGYYDMALLMQIQGRFEESMPYIQEVLRIQPDLPRAYNLLGVSLRSLGRLDEAMQYFRRAISIRPDYALGRHNLARALATAGRCQEARDEWHEAYKIQTNWHPPLEFAARMLATHADAGVRDPQQAIRLAERAAILTMRKDVRALDTLAAAYAAAGRFEQAVTTCQEAIDLVRASPADKDAERLAQHLELYRRRQPLIETPSDRDVGGSTGGWQ